MKIIADNEKEKKRILDFSRYMHDFRIYRSKKGRVSIITTENGKPRKYSVNKEGLWFFKGDGDIENYLAHIYTTPDLVKVKKLKHGGSYG